MEGSIYDRGGVMVSDKERSKEEVLFARTSLAKSYNLRAGNQMFGQPKSAPIFWYPGTNHMFKIPN